MKKVKENNLRKNFFWNIIGLSFYGLVSLFLLIIVKRVNGFKISGIFSYAYSICTLFYFFAIYYSRPYQLANYGNNKSFNQFFSFRIITIVLSLIFIFLFSLISGFSFFKIEVIMLLMIFRVIDALSESFYGYLQENDNLYEVGISYTLKSLLGTIVFLIIDILTQNVIISIISLVILSFLVLIFYDYKNYNKIAVKRIQIDFSNNKLILKESFSIFIFSFLSIYLANAEKYVMTYTVSDKIQSIFAILIMPATVLSLVGNYLMMPFMNDLKNLSKEGDYKKFNILSLKILFVLIVIGIFGTIVCDFIGIPILNIIYGIHLNEYKSSLIIIIIASIFNAASSIISGVLTLINKNNFQTVFYLLSCICATVLCHNLIKKDAIIGASVSYMISYLINFVMFIIYYFICIKKLGGIRNEKKS